MLAGALKLVGLGVAKWAGVAPIGVGMPALLWAMFSCACLSNSGSRLRTACTQERPCDDVSFDEARKNKREWYGGLAVRQTPQELDSQGSEQTTSIHSNLFCNFGICG